MLNDEKEEEWGFLTLGNDGILGESVFFRDAALAAHVTADDPRTHWQNKACSVIKTKQDSL